MLLELAIGDAYGAGFEYANGGFVRRHNDLARYVQHPRHGIRPGSYTDDTQMSLAVAEALLSGRPWTKALLAESFVTAFKRDPREGYAGRFHAFLIAVKDGAQFLAEIEPASDKSGAAMRAPLLGVLPTIEAVTEAARVQAAVTHDTPDGINAAIVAALMAHYFLYDLGPKSKLGGFLARQVPGPWAQPWHGKVGPKGSMSVRAAVTAIGRNDSLSGLLQDCVSFTGDVDTVAAIALAAASCSREIAADLPAHLVRDLEAGQFGRKYLVDLDRQLMELRNHPVPRTA